MVGDFRLRSATKFLRKLPHQVWHSFRIPNREIFYMSYMKITGKPFYIKYSASFIYKMSLLVFEMTALV